MIMIMIAILIAMIIITVTIVLMTIKIIILTMLTIINSSDNGNRVTIITVTKRAFTTEQQQ